MGCCARLMILLLVALTPTIAGSSLCQQPDKRVHFVRMNLAGDIALTLVRDDGAEHEEWTVKGGNDAILTKQFEMRRDGPFWNLVTKAGIQRKPGTSPIFMLKLDLACKTEHSSTPSVFEVQIAVTTPTFLDKVQITIPENTPPENYVYHDTDNKDYLSYNKLKLENANTRDGFEYFHLNKDTGSVLLSKPLDYDKGPKLFWLAITRDRNDPGWRPSKYMIRIFRIEVTNINDNAPEFLARKDCTDNTNCTLDVYDFKLQADGTLPPDASVYAIDEDGDDVTYQVLSVKLDLVNGSEIQVEAMPSIIDATTGKLKKRIEQLASEYRVNTISIQLQASDGFHKTRAAAVVEEHDDTKPLPIFTPWNDVMDRTKPSEPLLPPWLVSFLNEKDSEDVVNGDNLPTPAGSTSGDIASNRNGDFSDFNMANNDFSNLTNKDTSTPKSLNDAETKSPEYYDYLSIFEIDYNVNSRDNETGHDNNKNSSKLLTILQNYAKEKAQNKNWMLEPYVKKHATHLCQGLSRNDYSSPFVDVDGSLLTIQEVMLICRKLFEINPNLSMPSEMDSDSTDMYMDSVPSVQNVKAEKSGHEPLVCRLDTVLLLQLVYMLYLHFI